MPPRPPPPCRPRPRSPSLGARIEIAQTGAGQITASGAGVTLRLPSGKTAKTRVQYSIIVLTKRGTDEWILSGDLA